jgi:hypothetical protein
MAITNEWLSLNMSNAVRGCFVNIRVHIILACSWYVNDGQCIVCSYSGYMTQKANTCVDLFIILSHNVQLYQHLALSSSSQSGATLVQTRVICKSLGCLSGPVLLVCHLSLQGLEFSYNFHIVILKPLIYSCNSGSVIHGSPTICRFYWL